MASEPPRPKPACTPREGGGLGDEPGGELEIERLHVDRPASPKARATPSPAAPPVLAPARGMPSKAVRIIRSAGPADAPKTARPADQAAHEKEAQADQSVLGYTEIAFEFQDGPKEDEGGVPAPPAVATAEAPAMGETFDAEALSVEAAPPPPPEPPKAAPESTMQAKMEITDFFAMDAGHGFASTSEAPYTGLALEMRDLLLPIEELLHDRAGGDGGISVRHRTEADICSRFAAELLVLASKHRAIPLVVKAGALHCEGRPVLREAKQTGSGLYRLYAAGVQTLTLVEGIDRQQGETLAQVLTQPASEGKTAAELEGDVSRWFWELGLLHVRLSILETFVEVEPLPETEIPVLEVPDQAVEQMTRLRSRLLSSVPGAAAGRTRVTAVRNLAISQDDLRALDRDLFRLGAELLAASGRRGGVIPFPELPPPDAEVREALDQDAAQVEPREVEALLQIALLLQEPERIAPIVERLVARPRAHFAAGEVDKGLRFLKGLRSWAVRAPGEREKGEAVDAIFSRACDAAVLLPLLERFRSLPSGVAAQVIELLDLLPAPATATLGAVAARPSPPAALVNHFKARLEKDLGELASHLEQLSDAQAVGLLDGAVAVKAEGVERLALLLSRADAPALRQASARACAALAAESAQPLLARLVGDEEPAVRQAAVHAIQSHREAAVLAVELLRAVASFRYHEWLFAEKRAAMFAVARAMEARAREPLRRIVQRPNPYKRRTHSETRAAAALALALLRDPADEKLAVALAQENERRVVQEAAKDLLESLRGDPQAPGALVRRFEEAYARYDRLEGEEPEETEQGEAAVHELSPQALKAMRVDDVLAAPGDPAEVIGSALLRALSAAVQHAVDGRTSSEGFAVAVGRAANLARALIEHLDGPAAVQCLGDHVFVNGRRIRLAFAAFAEIEPLRQVLHRLRIQEVMFAEPPARSDLVEMLYAVVLALKVEREPWNALQRELARIRLRELSLIKESWGRQSDVGVDVRANAARLFGTLYLWLEDVSRLPDGHDLLPLRAERLVRALTDAQEEGEALLDGLIGPKANPGDAVLYLAHCIMLASVLARWLGCRRDQIASLLRCALCRQVGLLSFPRPLLEDLGAESLNEATELQRAPLHSAARVAAAANAGQADLKLPLVSAFEALAPISQAGARAQKYLRSQRPLAHARILAIAERYVFLTSSFPRRRALAPDEALARMLADPELDAGYVKAFANRAAVVPAGSRVRLFDGREALVVSAPMQVSRADPLVLKVLRDGAGEPAGDPLRGAAVVARTGEEESPLDIAGVVDATATEAGWSELAGLLL